MGLPLPYISRAFDIFNQLTLDFTSFTLGYINEVYEQILDKRLALKLCQILQISYT